MQSSTNVSESHSHTLSSQNSEQLNQTPWSRYPAIVHASVFTAFVLPLTLLPYLVARKQIVGLRRTIGKMEDESKYLRRALDLTVAMQTSTKAELHQLQSQAKGLLQTTSTLKEGWQEHQGVYQKDGEAVKAELRQLREELQHSRTQGATFRALGASLADVAAFMEEMEIDLGMETSGDKRGIERLRLLALRMQNLDDRNRD